VKLLDLGISKLFGPTADARDMLVITRQEELVGTPAYMSPEQAISGSVGPWSDLYSLGVVLYEMLAGVRPHAVSSARFFAQLLTQPARPLREAAPWVPEGIAEVVDRLLERDPEARPKSGREVLAALDRAALEPAAEDEGLRTVVTDSALLEALLEPARAASRGDAFASVSIDHRDADEAPPRAREAPPALSSGVRTADPAADPDDEGEAAEVFDRASLRQVFAASGPSSRGVPSPPSSGTRPAPTPPAPARAVAPRPAVRLPVAVQVAFAIAALGVVALVVICLMK
jgi:serine/threonine protein kinase